MGMNLFAKRLVKSCQTAPNKYSRCVAKKMQLNRSYDYLIDIIMKIRKFRSRSLPNIYVVIIYDEIIYISLSG